MQNFPFEHQLVVTMRRIKDETAASRLAKVGVNAEQLSALKQGALTIRERRDPYLAAQYQESQEASVAMMNGEKMVEYAIQIWFSAKTQKELEDRNDIIARQFRRCGGAEMALEEMRPVEAFLSMLPGHHSLLGKRNFSTISSAAADLVPLFQSWPGAERPLAYFSARGKEIVGYNPFDPTLSSWNGCVAGGTGKGKSVLVRYLLTPWVAKGGRAIIVTRGKDYERFGALWNATTYSFHGAHETPLGPFPRSADFLDPEFHADTLERLQTIVALMVSEPDEKCPFDMRRAIDHAIKDSYERLSLEESPTFLTLVASCDKLHKLQEMPGDVFYRLKIRLEHWLSGGLRRALLKNIRPSERPLEIWNLEDIKDPRTQTVVLALLSSSVSQSLKRGQTQFILDEVWSLFRSPEGALLVENAYRTIRKQRGSILIVSQGVTDYISLPAGLRNAILNNAEVQFILPHSAPEWSQVAEVFRLNEQEQKLLESLQSSPGHFSEFLGFFGSVHKRLRLVLTPFEYWLGTSHPEDLATEIKRMTRCPDEPLEARIEALADTWPNGAFSPKKALPTEFHQQQTESVGQ